LTGRSARQRCALSRPVVRNCRYVPLMSRGLVRATFPRAWGDPGRGVGREALEPSGETYASLHRSAPRRCFSALFGREHGAVLIKQLEPFLLERGNTTTWQEVVRGSSPSHTRAGPGGMNPRVALRCQQPGAATLAAFFESFKPPAGAGV
jgi:hypothetical protein